MPVLLCETLQAKALKVVEADLLALGSQIAQLIEEKAGAVDNEDYDRCALIRCPPCITALLRYGTAKGCSFRCLCGCPFLTPLACVWPLD